MNIFRIAAASAMLTATVCAGAAHAANQCFYLRDIENSRSADANTLYIRVNVNDIYRMDMASPCPDLARGEKVTLRQVSGIGSICHGIDLNMYIGDHGVRSQCVIGSITKLTPDEAAALPHKIKP